MIYIVLTLLGAIFLEALPIPTSIEPLRPEFLLMSVLFWVMSVQYRGIIFLGWFAALLLDATVSAPLGSNAFSVLFVLSVGFIFHNRFVILPLVHQMIFIGFILFFALLISLLIDILTQDIESISTYFIPVLSSMLLWPILHSAFYYLLKRSRLKALV